MERQINGKAYTIEPLANLRGADLRSADLRSANLRLANLRLAKIPHFQIPQEGALICWGKKAGHLVKLWVPPNARRTACLINRKCRVERALVLWVENGAAIVSPRTKHVIYEEGRWVHPDNYDPDIRVDCSHGIHVFMTREEAEEWTM